jgi:hypothetical protein
MEMFDRDAFISVTGEQQHVPPPFVKIKQLAT